MGARPHGSFVPVENDTPNLCYCVYNRNYCFPCIKCMEFWKHIFPDTSDPDNTTGTSKFAMSIKTYFESQFRICEQERRKWSQSWKLIKHALEVVSEKESVCVVKFIRFVRWFGCMRPNSEGSCHCLDQIFLLLDNGGVTENGRYTSWFAGVMTQSEAHERLRPEESGTYLVRFSEGNADDGWYAVAIKDDEDGVKHFQIKTNPKAACADGDDKYNGRFQLCSDTSDDEQVYPTLVRFVNDHLLLEGVGDVSCDDICPNLPLNSTFQGYERNTTD